MDNEVPLAPYKQQNRAIPKILGILNIVFAAMLLIVGLCQLGSSAAMPIYSKMMKDVDAQQKAQAEARAKETIKQLEEQEKEAKSEEDKAEIREAKKVAAARPPGVQIPMIDIMKLANNRQISSWMFAELLTGVAVNIAMLAAGIGLVRFKGWGRTLGLWTAAVKIFRLIVVYTYAALVVVPPFSKLLGEEVGKMMLQQQQAMGRPAPPGMTPDTFVKIYTVTYTIMCVMMIVLGVIYPLISLWLLSRPSAKAACAASASKPIPSDTW
jgi:Sec-independent protein translocase protein TatA